MKHWSRKLLGIVLCVAMVIGMVPGVMMSAAGADDDYEYTTSGNNAEITKYKGEAGDVIIPNNLNGYTVTGIGKNAFSTDYGLKSITIPSSVTSIGDSAFYECCDLNSVTFKDNSQLLSIGPKAFQDSELQSITIPDSVTSIGEFAFSACENLSSITFGQNSSLDSIGNYAFSNSGLTSITIPDSVTSIGDNAFLWCDDLSILTIGENSALTSIGESAFEVCKFTSVTIPATVTTIGDCAFLSCSGLTAINVNSKNKNYSSDDGVLFDHNKTKLICYPEGKTSNTYTIPATVTGIVNYALTNSSLKTIVSFPTEPPGLGGPALFYNPRTQFYVRRSAYKTEKDWSDYKDRMKVISTVTLNDNITATGDATTTYNNVKYYAEGTKLTLSGSNTGYYVANDKGENITASVMNDSILTMPDCDVIVSKGYMIETKTKPSGGGNVSGRGVFTIGSEVTLTATPETGYGFVRWEENGTELSKANPYSFFIDAIHYKEITAVFAKLITNTVTFKVVNGAWDDQTTAEKKKEFTYPDNEDLAPKLQSADIPSVGSSPAFGYKTAGSWTRP